MAATKLWPIRNSGKKTVKAIMRQVVEYAENEEKTKEKKEPHGTKSSGSNPLETIQSVWSYAVDKNEGMQYVTGINCTVEHAPEEMMITRNRWPPKGKRILYHGYQSFAPGEVTPEQAHRIGVRLARDLWGDRFEIVVATHLDRAHIHSHFVINAVSFLDGRMFIWDREYPRMQKRSDELCEEESLSVLPPSRDLERVLHQGEKRENARGGMTIESIVKEDIDSCVSVASSIDEWFFLMKEKGYHIDTQRKYLRVYPYGHSRCIRIDRRFGEGYTLEGLDRRIREKNLIPEEEPEDETRGIKEIFTRLREEEPYPVESVRSFPENRKVINDPRRIRRRADYPIGIQITSIRIIYRAGYHRTPAQVARIHYIYREELTKLDRYIEQIKFLIYEDIRTEDELQRRYETENQELTQAKKDIRNLQKRLRNHPEDEKTLRPEIREIKDRIRQATKNTHICQDILNRMKVNSEKESRERELKNDVFIDHKVDASERHRGTERSEVWTTEQRMENW